MKSKKNSAILIIENLKASGGAEKVAAILGNSIEEITVGTWYKKQGPEHKVRSRRILGAPPGLPPVVLLRRILKIGKLAREYGTFIAFMEPSIVPLLLTKLLLPSTFRDKVVISSIHNNIQLSRYPRYLKYVAKKLYRYSDIIITPSRGVSSLFSEIPTPVITIENPVDVENILQRDQDENISSAEVSKFDFINIGRLTYQKGHWFLIRSFKYVVEHYPEATLGIVGEGNLKPKLARLIRELNLERNVCLLGWVQDPFSYLRHTKAFVSTSLWEGFPVTILEVLALNKLVIYPDCDFGPREILAPEVSVDEEINYPYYGSYGILTKPFPDVEIWDDRPLIEEEKMLAELMLKTLEEPKLRRKYSPRGLKRAQKNTPEKIIKKWKKNDTVRIIVASSPEAIQ